MPNISQLPTLVDTIKKITSSISAIKVIATAVILILTLYSAHQAKKIDQWNAHWNAYVHDTVSVALKYSDSLKKVVQSQDTIIKQITLDNQRKAVHISHLTHFADSVTAANDSTLAHLNTNASYGDSSCALPLQLANSYKYRGDSLQTALNLAKQTIVNDTVKASHIAFQRDTETHRADSLYTVLTKLPKSMPSDKLLGLIPLPDRKTSFYIGTGTGIILVLLLGHIKI